MNKYLKRVGSRKHSEWLTSTSPACRTSLPIETRSFAPDFQRIGFHADFLLCPLGIGALVTYTWTLGPSAGWGEFMLAFIAGSVCWTLAEYLLHRFFLHGVPPLRRSHLRHHAAPQALIGAPVWLSPLLAILLFAVTDLVADAALASGLTAGVTLGYLIYACIHYATHHLPNLRWAWLRKLRRAHALHHRSEMACNFGVSTGLWDMVFRSTAANSPVDMLVPPSRNGRPCAPPEEERA